MNSKLTTVSLIALATLLFIPTALAQRQAENLGRGLVAMKKNSTQIYVNWRLLATDPADISFKLYRVASGVTNTLNGGNAISNTTDYLDTPTVSVANTYFVRPVINGVEGVAGASFTVAASAPTRQYIPVPLHAVDGGLYPPYDVKFCWVGDLNGDGEYDFVVDRLSTTTESRQYVQAYLRDGTFLWQMDMGHNSTNQYSHEPGSSAISIGMGDCVTVYDMDGDGKAEVLVRTANGVTVTNAGGVQVANITAGNDLIQYMTVLDGMTGVARDSKVIPNPYSAQGPIYGHMGIMYADGVRPTVLYEGWNRNDSAGGDEHFNVTLTTWDFRNGALTQRWWWERGYNPMGEGHQIRIADVDHDGKDEFCEIGFVVDDNGTTLFNTELTHGDRFHISDLDPERPGLETFAIQQNNPSLLATVIYDSGTGDMIKKWYAGSLVDVGRGTALDFHPGYKGCEVFSTQPRIFDCKGNQIATTTLWPPEALWWDGDILRETMDGDNWNNAPYLNSPFINNPNPTTFAYDRIYTIYSEGVHQAYGARSAFWGDILGDWREEVVLVANDYSEFRIYTTTTSATNRLYCLMQNPAYRMQATCKGYYQASYPDYYLGQDMNPPVPAPISDATLVWRGGGSNDWDSGSTANWFTNNLWISNNTAVVFTNSQTVLFDSTGSNDLPINIVGTLTPGAVKVHTAEDYTFGGSGALSGSMKLTKAGAGKLTLSGTNTYTGPTTVWEGPLLVNGSLSSSAVTVRGGAWLDGRIGGTGVVGAAVTLEPGGGLSPGQGTNSPGTISFASGLTLRGLTINDFDLSDNPTGPTNDLVSVTGNLTLQGTNILKFNLLNAALPPSSVYPLITYSGSLSGNLNNFVVQGLDGIPFALTNPPGQIALLLKSYRAPATITWTGGSGGNAWDLLTTSNWLNGAARDQFAPGDTVRFDSIGTSNLTVNLTGALPAGKTIVDSTANYTFAGSGFIMGSGGISKSNTGTLTITGRDNTFTGPTLVAGGTLVINDLDLVGYASSLGSAPNNSPTNLVLTGSSTLRLTSESATDRGLTISGGTNSIEVLNAADQLTLLAPITGTGAFQKLGPGLLAFSAANSYVGTTIIKAGEISLGGDAANTGGFGPGTPTIILDGGGLTMFINNDTTQTSTWNLNVVTNSSNFLNLDWRCVLAGSGTGGGTLTMWTPYVRADISGNWSTFTGQLNVTTDVTAKPDSDRGGDFRIANSAGFPNARINLQRLVSLQNRVGGTPTISIGELSGEAGCNAAAPGANSGVGVNWSVGSLNTSATFGGNTYNNVGFIKVGTGTWTWTGTNISHTGPTTVNGGTLLINGDAEAATGAVTIGVAGTLGGGGTIGGTTTVNGKLAPGNNAVGMFTCTNNVTFGASGTAVIEINKTAGTRDLLDVGKTLTYGGTLQVTNLAGALASGDSFKIFNAAIYAGAFISSNLPPLASGLYWNVSALVTNGTISVTGTNTSLPKALVWKGEGAANAWDINVTANWLDTNNAAAYFANYDSVTFNDTGSNNTPVFLTGSLQPSALVVNATKDYTFGGSGSIAGTNSLVKSGSGTLALGINNTYSGATIISNGTLRLTTTSLGLAHRWSFNNSLADSVGGQTATVVEVGANNVILGAADITLAGGTRTTSDYVSLGADLLPNVETPVTIELWAKQNAVQNWARIFDFGSSTTENLLMSWTMGTTLTQDRVEWKDGTTTTTDNSNQPYTLGTEFHIAMVIEPGAGAGGTTRVTWYRAAATNSVLGAARGTTNTANTLSTFNDSNCWLGRSEYTSDNTASAAYNEVRVWNRALSATELQTLHAAGADANLGTVGIAGTGALPTTTAVNLAGTSAKLENLSGQSQTVASLTGVTGSEVKLTSGALIAGGDNSSTTFAGFFSGTNGFTKTGSGTLTLIGNSTHTGATTVSAGTLLVHGNSATASGTVTVANGATLGGNGVIGGATTIQTGGILAPGASIGTITFNNSLLLSGTTVMEISHTPLTNDVVNKPGTFTYGGALLITNISGTLTAGDSFKLFNASAYTASFSSITLPALGNGLVWTTNTLNTTGTITVSSAVSTTPTNLTFTISGNSLTLSWPASHIGWTLQAQTNALTVGLGATWHPVPGSTTTNFMTLPVNPANPTVFYRLTYP